MILDLDAHDGIETKEDRNIHTKHEYRTKEELGTSVLFSKENDLSTIQQYISGMKWEVDYFLQILGVNEIGREPDINLSNTVMKYNRINKFELTVQEPIRQNHANDEIMGTAIINAGFVPNKGDAFVAVLSGGQYGIFVIQEDIKKRNYNNNDVYEVSYKLHSFAHKDHDYYNDLVHKTVKDYVYDKEHLLDYSAPIILAQDYKRKVNLKAVPNELLDYYLKTMVNTESNTILLPSASSLCVDLYVVDFLFKFINQDDNPIIQKLTRIENPKDDNITYTVWDAILERNSNYLEKAEREIGLKYKPGTMGDPRLRALAYLSISFNVGYLYGEQPIDIDMKTNDDAETIIKPLTESDNYVFSDAFYDNERENATEIEKYILDYIDGKRISDDNLYKLLDEYTSWEPIDQYYLIPILILFAIDSVKFTYSDI